MKVTKISVDPDPYEAFRLAQGYRAGDFLFISGQAAINGDGQLVGLGDFDAQADQVFANLAKVLHAGGSSLANVIKVSIFLRDMSNFSKIVELRGRYFTAPYPADTIVEVSSLYSPEALIEIEAIAVVDDAVERTDIWATNELLMSQTTNNNTEAMAILTRMFAAEMQFMESSQEDVSGIAAIFHPDIVVHEPASLPYAGDWRGHESLGRLFKSMRDAWSSMNVENIRATMDGDTLFMCCTLVATSRNSGKEIRQPFAEVLRIEAGLVVEGTPYYYDTAVIKAALV